MSVRLSIIVPIYNTEKYLVACLDSIVNQTYKNVEIILVNDGSTDGSKSICEAYASKDERILLLDKPNGGQASARNNGLDVAIGDCIAFVDSDDTISKDLFQNNMLVLKKDSGIDVLQFPIYMNFGLENGYLRKPSQESIRSREILYKKWIETNTISWLVCNKIFKKEVFKNLRFKENMVYEDNYMMADILSRIKHLFINDEGIYYYHARDNSTTTSTHTLKKEQDTQLVSLHILNKLSKVQNTTKAKVIMLSRIFNVYQSIKYNYKVSAEIDTLFFQEMKNLTLSSIFKSNLIISQKIKMVFLKLIGANTYLKLYN